MLTHPCMEERLPTRDSQYVTSLTKKNFVGCRDGRINENSQLVRGFERGGKRQGRIGGSWYDPGVDHERY